jgi:hypothetical protein
LLRIPQGIQRWLKEQMAGSGKRVQSLAITLLSNDEGDNLSDIQAAMHDGSGWIRF